MTPEFIVNHLWQSSCFGLLASLLAFMLRGNSPKVRYWVWLSASLKFLVPWVLLVSLGSMVPWPVYRAATVATSTLPDTLIQIAEPFSLSPYAAAQTQAQTHWGVTALAFLWAAGFVVIAFTRCRSWYGVRAMLRAGTPVKLPIPAAFCRGVPALVTSSTQEPGVVGFLKPVLVLPALLLERLNPEQLEALLAHELSHVRRRDNLFAALHMGVETIFWFHPLVWWIGSRMLEERELACDEEVLRLGCEPTDYARGILTVCEHYSEAPLACVSGVTGADIKKRLRTILRGTLSRELNGHKKVALAFAAVAAIAVPVGLGVWNVPAARAQSTGNTATKRPEFEVVSIKPTSPTGGGAIPIGRSVNPGSVTLLGITPKDVIARAYSLMGYQISGPRWIDQERYDIVARVGRSASDAEHRLMLQSMLADRFQLTAHTETRVLPAYELVVGKNGPKLQQATPDDIGSRVFPNAPGVSAKQISMARLAELLSMKLDRPVADKTGLSGLFDIELKWTPDTAPSDADLGPSVFTAVREQLGLRLEARKLPIEVLIIDHAEKPTPN